MSQNDTEATQLLSAATREFSDELVAVIRALLWLEAWAGTQVIVIGGGFRQSRIGQLAIRRAAGLLTDEGLELRITHYCSDHSGLVGSLHLAPSVLLQRHDGILAIDIGGSNIRLGIVETRQVDGKGFSHAAVSALRRWSHRDAQPNRDELIGHAFEMVTDLLAHAHREGLALAPFIGIACPGLILPDGSIQRGTQNLPGDWQDSRFNLPRRFIEAFPKIGAFDTAIVLHNDAVVQGLSELPFMPKDVSWGALTIGSGLGNAHFRFNNDDAEGRHVI